MSDILVWAITHSLAKTLIDAAFDYLQHIPTKEQDELADEQGAPPDDTAHEITPVFGKYITRNTGFAKELGSIRVILKDYAIRDRVQRPLNILLAAEPGNGKSFLIKQLANSVKSHTEVQFEEFHVAAFRTADDLLGVFQRVQSANLHGKLPFVLFDEVDGKVDGRHVLANFLAPMWDGIFHAGKESFALGKAVFCFAASKMVPPPTVENVLKKEEQEKNVRIEYSKYSEEWRVAAEKAINAASEGKGGIEAIEKCKDFIDRVDVMLCIPPIHPLLLGDDAAKEYVDLVCLLVQKHFPEVTRIELAGVAALTKRLMETSSRRRAERTIFCSRTPKNETYEFVNLPENEQERYSKDKNISDLRGKFLRFTVKEPAS